MMNKKGDVRVEEAVEIVIMILLILTGYVLLNMTSENNFKTSKQLTAEQRDMFYANEILHSVSLISIETENGMKLTFPEALDKHYVLLNKNDDLSEDYEKLITKTLDKSIHASRPVLKSQLYKNKVLVRKGQLEIYNRPDYTFFYMPFNLIVPYLFISASTKEEYYSSLILPSSLGPNYYINVSLYFKN